MSPISKYFFATVLASAPSAPPDPDAHQKWRILITTNNGHGALWGVGEFQLFDAAGVNHALASAGGVASSSGDNYGVPAVTIDGVLSSNWLGSGVSGKWLEVDASAKVNIVKFGLSTISDISICDIVTPAQAEFQYYDVATSTWTTKLSIDATGLWKTSAAGKLKLFAIYGEWFDSVVDTIATQNAGWTNYTMRNYIPKNGFQGYGDKAKATFVAGTAGLVVDEMFVGTSTAADPTTFQATPTRITFGGSNGISAGSNADWTTDEFDLPTGANYDNLLFSWFMSGGDLQQNSSSAVGGRGYYVGVNSADDLALPSIAGASSAISYLKSLQMSG